MSKKSKTKEVLSEEDKKRIHELRVFLWQSAFTIARLLLLALSLLGGLYIVFALPVLYSAGKTTTINHVVNWAQSVSLPTWIAVVLAAVLGIGWRHERTSRLRERKEKDERLVQLEKHIDPMRTSSGLLPDGTPSKENSR